MKLLALVLLLCALCAPWIINVAKFIDCDFESDYRCEAIHGIGVVIPPAAFITVWFADDSE